MREERHLSTAFAWEAGRWVIVLILGVFHIDTSVWPVGWALLSCVTQDVIFCAFYQRSFLLFALIQTCILKWLSIECIVELG